MADEPDRGDEIASADDHRILDSVWEEIARKGFRPVRSVPEEMIEEATEGGQYTEEDVRQALLALSIQTAGKARQDAGDDGELPPEAQEQLARIAEMASPEQVKEILATLNGQGQ